MITGTRMKETQAARDVTVGQRGVVLRQMCPQGSTHDGWGMIDSKGRGVNTYRGNTCTTRKMAARGTCSTRGRGGRMGKSCWGCVWGARRRQRQRKRIRVGSVPRLMIAYSSSTQKLKLTGKVGSSLYISTLTLFLMISKNVQKEIYYNHKLRLRPAVYDACCQPVVF